MPSLLSKGEGDAAPSTSNKRSSKFGLGRSKSKKNPLTEIKVDLHESHAEKEARRLKSYADPNMAVNQLEPSAMQMTETTMESLSMRQHRDIYGNPIVDPDLSNPTRHRLERPLDTIRAFEAAIEDSYSSRRLSYGSKSERRSSNYDHRFGYPSNPEALTTPTSTVPGAPRRPHGHHHNSASTTSSPSSSHYDDDDHLGPSSAAGGAVQPPPTTFGNNPYGYGNAGVGSSRSRHFITPPAGQYPTPPTSQAGMAWASAPARKAPPRRPIEGGPDDKGGRFKIRFGRKKH